MARNREPARRSKREPVDCLKRAHGSPKVLLVLLPCFGQRSEARGPRQDGANHTLSVAPFSILAWPWLLGFCGAISLAFLARFFDVASR